MKMQIFINRAFCSSVRSRQKSSNCAHGPEKGLTSPPLPAVNALKRRLNPLIISPISDGLSSKLFLPKLIHLLPSFTTFSNSRSPSLSGHEPELKLSTEEFEFEVQWCWCVSGEVGERRLASCASISERMVKKCEFDIGVRWRSSRRISSEPSVNFERRRGRVWIRSLGDGVVVGVACAIFGAWFWWLVG